MNNFGNNKSAASKCQDKSVVSVHIEIVLNTLQKS